MRIIWIALLSLIACLPAGCVDVDDDSGVPDTVIVEDNDTPDTVIVEDETPDVDIDIDDNDDSGT